MKDECGESRLPGGERAVQVKSDRREVVACLWGQRIRTWPGATTRKDVTRVTSRKTRHDHMPRVEKPRTLTETRDRASVCLTGKRHSTRHAAYASMVWCIPGRAANKIAGVSLALKARSLSRVPHVERFPRDEAMHVLRHGHGSRLDMT